MIQRFNEYNSETEDRYKPIASFTLKDSLNDKIWDEGDILNDGIRSQLLDIATDLFNSLELEVELVDIILTGSLANFNHSEYSDFDLHLLFNFIDLNNDIILVRKYCDSVASNWNTNHDIKIEGFEVEVYLQDTAEKHISSGQYSILNNEWVVKPEKQNFVPDEELIKVKSKSIMDRIDDIEVDFEGELEYDVIIDKIKRVFKKIKDGRKAGLSRDGEYSVENLVFKLLRRNGYIKKIIDIRRDAYDKKFK